MRSDGCCDPFMGADVLAIIFMYQREVDVKKDS